MNEDLTNESNRFDKKHNPHVQKDTQKRKLILTSEKT
jgi:superfamily I DNA/RNA helicase